MESIVDATDSYERWLRERTSLVEQDLELKHDKMATTSFAFLRATYYRWAQVFGEQCPDLASATVVLAVGDLHVNNFGLWRDGEGRLAWGVNDFDEAHSLAYTNDLVRLAVSAALLGDDAGLDIRLKHACNAILHGYEDGLRRNGRAFVLAERNDWIRDLATTRLQHPDLFWSGIEKLAEIDDDVPADAVEALEALLPEPGMAYRVARRTTGVGSLGRARFVAISEWSDGRIAREAKAIVPSASVWLAGDGGGGGTHYQHFFGCTARARDPWVACHGDWIVRRLGPDCTRIELDSLPDTKRAHLKLLRAMGRETANTHLACRDAVPAVLADLESRPRGWLREAAKSMIKATRADWRVWRRR